ncbi:MAG: membrane protein insertion efficiency factor YidD [Verrucomicrobia bacterium]|nr:membrane protein insertion efficiency factor YidD [Verrucomicrobiota bacterium]
MRFKILFFLTPLTLFAEIGYVEPWGKDADLIAHPVSRSSRKNLSPMGLLAEQVILFHHNVLTHTTGPRSHFRPTSSQYMLQAIREYGFCKGYIMGCDRLLRENSDPWIYRTKEIKGALYKWDPPKK